MANAADANWRVCPSAVSDRMRGFDTVPPHHMIAARIPMSQVKDENLQAAVREILALIGYVDPVKGRGVRILTTDGGGTRGVVALQTLWKLAELKRQFISSVTTFVV
ncbi:Calcium-independent phospholipase A2-gamma [Fukomys damarensis]|uniref:Calcium-independent phospholipase A2-gamma n=1 Tax=Fukomys damarensis TaxID=885580 RepID=A0A091DKW4_FUKDA|nr:Calcium-independent phospholipase A2-gamma [Fukomys damarensis]